MSCRRALPAYSSAPLVSALCSLRPGSFYWCHLYFATWSAPHILPCSPLSSIQFAAVGTVLRSLWSPRQVGSYALLSRGACFHNAVQHWPTSKLLVPTWQINSHRARTHLVCEWYNNSQQQVSNWIQLKGLTNEVRALCTDYTYFRYTRQMNRLFRKTYLRERVL